MAPPKERKFGAIPDWAKTGAIDLRNYDYRAEAHCAQKSAERKGEHPTIELGSPDFPGWLEYFDRHLGGRPYAMRLLCDESIKFMTVPEQRPEWFDPTFINNVISWKRP